MNFSLLIRGHEDEIIHEWVDELYRERRVDLPSLLSYSQLVEYIPEVLTETGRLLDEMATEREIIETARRLRAYAQVRFQQRALIDEVARELTILRRILNDFFWREQFKGMEGDLRELREAQQRTGHLMDEMVIQAILVFAASWRPPALTRESVWPPPRGRSAGSLVYGDRIRRDE